MTAPARRIATWFCLQSKGPALAEVRAQTDVELRSGKCPIHVFSANVRSTTVGPIEIDVPCPNSIWSLAPPWVCNSCGRALT